MTRGLGTAYIKMRNGKTYWVAQRWVIAPDGTRKQAQGSSKTKQDAIARLDKSVARITTGTTIKRPQQTRQNSLTDLMTEWNNAKNVKDRTREHDAGIIKNHIASSPIGNKNIKHITNTDINKLLDSRPTQWSKIATLKLVRAFLKYALKHGMISKDPLIGVDIPKAPKPKHSNSVDMEERVKRLNGMLHWMSKTDWQKDHPMYWTRIMLALNGLRPGEARGLTWDSVKDLNGKNGIPRIIVQAQLGYVNGATQLIDSTKTNQPRIVVLRQQTVDALKAWKRIHDGYKRRKTWNPKPDMEDLVLTSETGRPLRQQEDDRIWQELLTEAQKNYKKKIYWTMLYNRHITVSIMRDAGINPSLVASMMGHSITVEDETYYQSQLTAQKTALDTMDGNA